MSKRASIKDAGSKGGSGEVLQAGRANIIAAKGIRTDEDFAEFMSAIMSDVVQGHLSPVAANAATNAGGKLLKLAELRLKMGLRKPTGNGSVIELALPHRTR